MLLLRRTPLVAGDPWAEDSLEQFGGVGSEPTRRPSVPWIVRAFERVALVEVVSSGGGGGAALPQLTSFQARGLGE